MQFLHLQLCPLHLLADLQASDSGRYECIASSTSGETSWSAYLMVSIVGKLLLRFIEELSLLC